MGLTHQKLVEILSYAMVLADNHVYTSGSIGTNAAVIRGALKAGKPDKLTVILPQSLGKQPYESQELLEQARAAPAGFCTCVAVDRNALRVLLYSSLEWQHYVF